MQNTRTADFTVINLRSTFRLEPRTDTALPWVEDRLPLFSGLHFHSVFQPEFWYLTRHSVPYCITPHGGYQMLLHRRWRSQLKLPLWLFVEKPALRGARFIHAVSAGDAAACRRLAPRVPICVIPHGVDPTDDYGVTDPRGPIA